MLVTITSYTIPSFISEAMQDRPDEAAAYEVWPTVEQWVLYKKRIKNQINGLIETEHLINLELMFIHFSIDAYYQILFHIRGQ